MPRPPGRKNNKTLMQEAVLKKLTAQAHGYLIHEVQDVLETVVQKAKDGDMTAAKLILDRAIPVKRSTEDLPTGKVGVIINIVGENDGQHSIKSTADRGEPGPADGETDPAPQGGNVLTISHRKEGNRAQ